MSWSNDAKNTELAEIWTCDSHEKYQAYFKGHLEANPIRLHNLISDELVSHSTDIWVDSYDPKTGTIFARVPVSDSSMVDKAVSAATEAFPGWSRTTRAMRSKYLRKIADLIEENRELFAVWESIDQGKTLERARVEVDRAVSNFKLVTPFGFLSKLLTFSATSRRTYCMRRLRRESLTAWL